MLIGGVGNKTANTCGVHIVGGAVVNGYLSIPTGACKIDWFAYPINS